MTPKRTLIAGIALLVTACGGSASTPSPTPVSHTINGTFTLMNGEPVKGVEKYCSGTGGYADITAGLGVVVKDATGTIVGTDALVVAWDPAATRPPTTPWKCRYTFVLTNVPDSAFYSIEVGHRGALTYSQADLESANWTVETTLGQ